MSEPDEVSASNARQSEFYKDHPRTPAEPDEDTQPMPAPEPDGDWLDRAIKIGHECVGITYAIEQHTSAYRNANGGSMDLLYETPLFKKLSARREELRKELLTMFPVSETKKED